MLYPNAMPVAIQVLQDRDLIITEVFAEEWLALNWAHAYAERLREHGWMEVRES